MRTLIFGLFAAAALLVSGCNSETAARQAFQSGNTYLSEQQYAEAIIEFRKAIQLDPRFGEARYKLAEAYVNIGDTVAAYSEQIRAADLLPDNMEAQLKAATYLLASGQFRDAKTRALRVLQREPRNVQALVVLPDAITFGARQRIAALAVTHRLPTAFDYRRYVVDGGLLSYGPDWVELARLVWGTYVDKILKGASPRDLPVQQPTRLEFVFNLGTARALGLEVPKSFLVIADEVFQ